MYRDFDYGLGKERMVQMRKEVEHDRLEARLSENGAGGLGDALSRRRGMAARGTAFLMALFR